MHGNFLIAAGASHRRLFIMFALLVSIASAVALGWVWTRQALSPAATAGLTTAPAVPAADGSIGLSAEQVRAQGIATAVAALATQLPVPGLLAQTAAPLTGSARVYAPYAGVVTAVLVDESAWVQRGQPLARVQSRDFLAAQAEQARARSEAVAAAQQAKRDAALLAEGLISVARNEQAQARADIAQSALRQANGGLARLQPANAGQAGEYEILAPFSGQIVRRHLSPGKSLAALDEAFVVVEAGRMDVYFSVPLRLHEAVVSGLQVRLPDAGSAQVVAVGAEADPASQSLRVRASIAPRQGAFSYALGQQFNVTLLLPVPPGAIAVPPSALLPAGEQQILYVLERDQAADRQAAGPSALQGGVRAFAVPVHSLGGDEAISVVLPVDQAGTQRLVAGAQVVTQGTALLKSMLLPQ